MAHKPTTSYREKYVQALKDQERIEKQLSFQTDLLKKTLFQVASAASGVDTQLDASISRLKDSMRGGSGAQAAEQMERVGLAARNFEQAAIQEKNKTIKVLNELIKSYLELQIPDNVKTGLSSFGKNLQKRLTSARQYPLVFEELAKLQAIALEAAANPEKQGLWQRIKGGKTLKNEENTPPTPIEIGEEPASPEISGTREVSQALTDDAQVGEFISQAQFSGDEDSYEEVAKRIARTLENLVSKIEPNDIIKHRVDIVRLRIQRGMDWYVLAVTLEDIRDILFLRYLQADEELSDYLNQVRSELGTIRQALAGAVEYDEVRSNASNQFRDQVSSGVDRMRASVDKEQSVDSLKHEVTEHISFISDALATYKSQSSTTLTEQLQQLVDQVKSIEHESKKTKEALEEQRHKATHDTLTELPNREAYIERAFQELQRFNRYERPLTMAVCDIDHFKKINDGYGHQAGDKVLKLIAKVIATRLREVDFIARFGGEEFVLLMPETAVEDAFKVLDKIRAVVAKSPFRFKDKPVKITISFGLVAFQPGDTVDAAFERADKALYKAKDEGRNRCIIADQ